MSKDNVVEVLLSSGGQGRVWESRPGKWSWAHPNGSDGCGCKSQAEAEAELQECEQPAPDDGTVASCQKWVKANSCGGFEVWEAVGAARMHIATFKHRATAENYCATSCSAALADKLAEALRNMRDHAGLTADQYHYADAALAAYDSAER